MKLSLHQRPGTYSVHRLAPDAPLPSGLERESFYALLRSPEELSLCCRAGFPVASQRREDGWACLEVAGPLDFSLTGIVSGLTGPLAAAGIPVFVISSFDTDYVLVKTTDLNRTAEVLTRHDVALRFA